MSHGSKTLQPQKNSGIYQKDLGKESTMAEVEFAGVTFRGGKMIAIVMALSTLGGGLYGAFEFYKDYMDMKEAIQSYTAPDLSGFDKKLAVLKQDLDNVKSETKTVSESIAAEVNAIKSSVVEAADYTRDIKNDLKNDIRAMEKVVEESERTTKETNRNLEKDMRDFKRQVDGDLKALDKKVADDIQKALNNPLNAIAQ
jgi:hypothetical protein